MAESTGDGRPVCLKIDHRPRRPEGQATPAFSGHIVVTTSARIASAS